MKETNKARVFQISISILVAVFIWLFVGTVDPVESTVWANNIEIEYLGEDTTLAEKGLMLLSESDKTVSLKLKGERNVIYKLDTKKVRVQVDLSGVTTTGVQNLTYRVIYPSTVSSNSVEVASASAYTATVYVGELYKKTVDVRYHVTGKVADGYMSGTVSILPETLEIRGQQEDILQVNYAKVNIDIEGATSTIAALLDYELYDYNDQLVENENIHVVSSGIQVSVPVLQIKEVPLVVKFQEAPGYNKDNVAYTIDHDTIKIAGEASKVALVNEIVLDTIELDEIDIRSTHSYEIPIPEGMVNLSSFSKAVVKINFIDFTAESFTANTIECANVPNGFSAVPVTEELQVTLCGTSADLATIETGDIEILVDMSTVTQVGRHTLPAEVRINSAHSIGVVGTYEVTVILETVTEPDIDNEGNETDDTIRNR